MGRERTGSGLQILLHSSTEPPCQRTRREKVMAEKSKILLVDDEPGMQRYIKTLLEVEDHKLETASTGEQALELMQKGLRPNLILLDLLMPGIDGIETLEALRKIEPKVKVVM